MRRNTTPTHTFELPFDSRLVTTAEITYRQGGHLVLRKNTADVRRIGEKISVQLTQEETLRFDDVRQAQIQCRILTGDGKALASPVYSVKVLPSLSEEVLT